jgi:hypothetical protein
MSEKQPSDTRTVYQIKVKGYLDSNWSEWFGGLTVTYDEHDNTILTGPVVDQAALYGILNRIRDLGLTLVSVNCVDSDSDDALAGLLDER